MRLVLKSEDFIVYLNAWKSTRGFTVKYNIAFF